MTLDPRLNGVFPALVTPLAADGASVDVPSLKRLIDYVLAAGVSGVVVLGGTGEYTALSMAERERVIAEAVAHVGGRVPVVVGIVSPGIGDAVQVAQAAERSGADYLMPITPYYVIPRQDGIIAWFEQLADVTALPIILYNIPSRTGVNLQPSTVVQMTDRIERIVGIKECNTSLGHFCSLVALAGDRLAILSGEDHYALPEFMLGARGAILASANVVPGHWSRLFQAVQSGAHDEAWAIFLRLMPLLDALFAETNPGPLKAALNYLGFAVGPVAKPLLEPSVDLRERLVAALEPLAAEIVVE